MNNTPDIVTIPDEEFDNWYGSTPATTAGADSLVGAQKPEATPASGAAPAAQPAPAATPAAPAPAAPSGELPLMEETDFAAQQPNNPPAAQPATEAKPDAATETPAAEATPAQAATPAPAETKELYKSMTDYLVQSGKWLDFDEREKMEFTDETFAQLVEKQDEFRLDQMWDKKIAGLGPYAQAIIDYEAKGGKAEDLISQFKAQEEAKQYDISTKDNQLAFIRNYYQKELGWKKDRVDKHVTLLELAGDDNIAAHATDLKADYDVVYNSRIEQMRNQQTTFRQEQERREMEYATAITQAISSRNDLSAQEKQYFVDFALKYNTQLPDGRMVNQAYVKLAQIQSNPELYTRFLEFIDNPEKFTQKISQQEETKATKKAFQFVVGGKQKPGAAHMEVQKPQPFSFKGFV